MNRLLPVLLALTCTLSAPLQAADGSYESGFEPTPPAPLPTAYRDYQILPASFSPNEQYALIYPKRSLLLGLEHPRLFLAALKPFRVLTQIPLRHSKLGTGHSYYAVNWASDSSAVVMIEGTKWGPDKVFLVPIRHERAGEITDLTGAVETQVRPDFKRSKVERYNDYYDFIFNSEGRITVNDQQAVTERGWDINEQGQVVIDCTCTTNPKGMAQPSWTVRFNGIWDIAKRRFIQKKYLREVREG